MITGWITKIRMKLIISLCFSCFQSKEDFPLRQTLVLAIVRENGRILMTRLLHASVFYLHSYMLSDVSDVIVELTLTDREVSLKA